MKIYSTIVLTSLCCASSAFGLHGRATGALKKTGFMANTTPKPMVQPLDLRGNRVTETVSSPYSGFWMPLTFEKECCDG